MVRAGDHARVDALDTLLWTYREESFLPHSAAREHSERQPVWLTETDEVPNEAQILFLVDGANEAAVSGARVFWKAAKAAGHDATYWKQSPAGRWEKQG